MVTQGWAGMERKEWSVLRRRKLLKELRYRDGPNNKISQNEGDAKKNYCIGMDEIERNKRTQYSLYDTGRGKKKRMASAQRRELLKTLRHRDGQNKEE